MEALNKKVALVCECGSRKFRVTVEQVVVDTYNLEGEKAWTFDTESVVEEERYLEVVCVKCGKVLVKRGIIITEEKIAEFLEGGLERKPTSEEVNDFLQFVEIDTYEWLRDNFKSWIRKRRESD